MKRHRWLIWLLFFSFALPLAPALADGPENGPPVTSASDAALVKLAPELRELARAGRESEVAFVTILMHAGTRWQPHLENALARRPLGELQWVSGEATGADLVKLAGLPGVISVVSPRSYAPQPAPGLDELRPGKEHVPPPLNLGTELADLAEKKEALRELTAGMTPEQVREKLRTDSGFQARFAQIMGPSWAVALRAATTTALPSTLPPFQAPIAPSGRDVQPTSIHVKDIHSAPQAWAKGFTGSGTVVAVVDSGVDFGHPDLGGGSNRMGTWATVPSGDYAGWPFSYNARSGFFAAQGIYQSPDAPWSYNALWHVETRPVGSFTSDGVIATADLIVDSYYGSTFTYVFSDTSKSGNYLYSVHPDPLLWIATYYLYAFWGIGSNSLGDPNAILVVDEGTAGVYDTVYVDLDFDLDFTDETPLTIDNPSTSHDLDGDGIGDLSAGLLTWISDGVHPPPGTNVLFESPPLPAQGALIAFVGDSDSHGTNCAGQIVAQGVITDPLGIGPINPIFGGGAAGPVLAGMAPDARVAAFQEGYYFPYDSWVLGALGFDGLPNTGDEAQINSNSWGMSTVINDGWDADSRFAHWLNHNYAPHMAFLMSTGNGGHGYGTVAPPSGGTIIGVGASTQYGTLTYFEPITDTGQLTYGDVVPWSNRGPGALGDIDPAVVAVGAWGTGANPLNYWVLYNGLLPMPAGSFAYDYFGGTSMSTPVAAGSLALVYQAFRSRHGRWPTYEEARILLMNGANDLGYDVLAQGAGNVNADRSTDIAAGLSTSVTPARWEAGNYRGTDYPAYPKILLPGSQDSQVFTISNPATAPATITLDDAVLSRIAEVTWTVNVVTSTSAVSWLTDVTPYVRAYDPDMMRAQVVFPLGVFDTNQDAVSDNNWSLYLYDWKDLNGDGNLWEDINGNGLVDAGEMDETPWEYNRLSHAYPDGNYLEASVGRPQGRMHDGIFMRLRRTYGSEPVTLQVRLAFYQKANWDWLRLDKSSLSVPGGGSAAFQATMHVPADARPGIYEGAIYARDHTHTAVIPVAVNIAAGSPTFSFGAQSLAEPVGDLPHDNGHLFGGVDWAWRYEVGDWRFFYFDNATQGNSAIIVDTRWGSETSPQPIFFEGFEGSFPPAGWEAFDNAGTGNAWSRNDALGVGNRTRGSGYAAAADSDAACNGLGWDTELWSPPIPLASGSHFYLGYENNFQDYAGAGEAWLDISIDDGITWANLTYWTEDHGPTYEVADLVAYAGQTIRLRWQYADNNNGCAWFWHIDEVAIYDQDPSRFLFPSDVDTWIYRAADDNPSTNDPAFFGPQGITLAGGDDDYAGAGVFRFGTHTGGPREVVGGSLHDGLGLIVLHNVLYGGQQLTEPIVGNAYRVQVTPSPVEIATDQARVSTTLSFTSEMTLTEGMTATAYGLYQPIAYADEPIARTGAARSYYLTIHHGGLLAVSTTSDDPGLDIDLTVYWDSDGDGTYETTIGRSLSPTSDESVSALFPGDGGYEIQIYGYDVPPGGASYDLRVEAAQGGEMSVSGVPSGTVPANVPVHLDVSAYHVPPAGDWYGLVFLGPAGMPAALQVPYIVHFTQQGIELTVVKSVNQSTASTGDVLIYTIVVHNHSAYTETVRVEDPLPDYIVYELGSGTATQGTPFYDVLNNTLSWEGDLRGGQSLIITFRAIASSGSGTALNKVTVTGRTSGHMITDTARTDVNPPFTHTYFPIIPKNSP